MRPPSRPGDAAAPPAMRWEGTPDAPSLPGQPEADGWAGGLRRGPPAHWLERVRQGAPQLLDEADTPVAPHLPGGSGVPRGSDAPVDRGRSGKSAAPWDSGMPGASGMPGGVWARRVGGGRGVGEAFAHRIAACGRWFRRMLRPYPARNSGGDFARAVPAMQEVPGQPGVPVQWDTAGEPALPGRWGVPGVDSDLGRGDVPRGPGEIRPGAARAGGWSRSALVSEPHPGSAHAGSWARPDAVGDARPGATQDGGWDMPEAAGDVRPGTAPVGSWGRPDAAGGVIAGSAHVGGRDRGEAFTSWMSRMVWAGGRMLRPGWPRTTPGDSGARTPTPDATGARDVPDTAGMTGRWGRAGAPSMTGVPGAPDEVMAGLSSGGGLGRGAAFAERRVWGPPAVGRTLRPYWPLLTSVDANDVLSGAAVLPGAAHSFAAPDALNPTGMPDAPGAPGRSGAARTGPGAPRSIAHPRDRDAQAAHRPAPLHLLVRESSAAGASTPRRTGQPSQPAMGAVSPNGGAILSWRPADSPPEPGIPRQRPTDPTDRKNEAGGPWQWLSRMQQAPRRSRLSPAPLRVGQTMAEELEATRHRPESPWPWLPGEPVAPPELRGLGGTEVPERSDMPGLLATPAALDALAPGWLRVTDALADEAAAAVRMRERRLRLDREQRGEW